MRKRNCLKEFWALSICKKIVARFANHRYSRYMSITQCIWIVECYNSLKWKRFYCNPIKILANQNTFQTYKLNSILPVINLWTIFCLPLSPCWLIICYKIIWNIIWIHLMGRHWHPWCAPGIFFHIVGGVPVVWWIIWKKSQTEKVYPQDYYPSLKR